MNLPELLKIAEAATQGEWAWGGTPVQTHEEALNICRESIERTENPDPYFCEVWQVGTDKRTAIVGNGPTGQANAAHIAAFNPAVAIELIKQLQEAEKLRDEAVNKYCALAEKFDYLVDKYVAAMNGGKE